MSTLDLSLDTLDLHLASIESADLNSLPTSIFAPTEFPAWTKMDLPTNISKTVETEPVFLEDFKWDGLDHLLNSKPVAHDASNTRVSVFERFDLGKITDDELSLFGEGGNNRFSFYVGKVSPPKVNTLSLMKSTTTPAPINTSSSKTLSQMTQGTTDKENRTTSTNVVPRKSESPKQPEAQKNSAANLKKVSKSSTPTRNSLSGLPSGLPTATTAKNSPRHSISRIPSSSSPSANASTSKKPSTVEKPAATTLTKPAVSQPPASTTGTALKKPGNLTNGPTRSISPTPNIQAQPQLQPQPTPQTAQPSTGIPAPTSVSLKKPVKKSSDIPKAAVSVPQKPQTTTTAPTSVQPVPATQVAPAVPSQPTDDKDPVAQLLARVKILEDTIVTMKKEHKQEVSALRTRLTLVEQKLQSTTE